MQVKLIDIPSEITDVSLKQYLADCSSVVRNAQPKDNERLFQRLLKESFGNKPSRVFEYIPCTIYLNTIAMRSQQIFGFMDWESRLYRTNARELLNWGWTWEEVLNTVDFTNYRTVKCVAPYFIYGQVSTHTQITSVSHSNRYTESDLGYWMPDEAKKLYSEDGWNFLVPNCAPNVLAREMKNVLGINRREVYARGSDMLQYRVFCLGGYTNNPNAWEHFINQRLHDPHTQKETRNLTAMIAECVK